MPRIRVIKPEYFKDEDIGSLTPLTRLLYIGLWCYADKAGRLEYRPNYLRVELLPYDRDADIVKELDTLCTPKGRTGIPFILKYEVDGIPYLQIIQWNKHQYLHKTNEVETALPEPPESAIKSITNGRTTIELRLKNGMTTAYEGKEREGKEGKGKRREEGVSSIFNFDVIWEGYPLKLGRKAALRHFNATVLTEQDYELIKKALYNYCHSEQVKNPKFIKHGSTWFNEWHDWIAQVPKPIDPLEKWVKKESKYGR